MSSHYAMAALAVLFIPLLAGCGTINRAIVGEDVATGLALVVACNRQDGLQLLARQRDATEPDSNRYEAALRAQAIAYRDQGRMSDARRLERQIVALADTSIEEVESESLEGLASLRDAREEALGRREC